jgi:hypothetical protein
MRITSAGNVGIGTSSPQAVTEIVGGTGDIKVLRLRTGDSTAANNSGIDFNVLSSATQGNRSAIITLDADGANATGSDYFQFAKTGGSNQKIFFPSNDLIFEGSSEYMRIKSSGNIGIGDTSPQDFVEINGSGRGLGGLTISNSSHTNAALSFARSLGATARIHITEPGAASTSDLRFQTSDASGGAPNLVTAMVII